VQIPRRTINPDAFCKAAENAHNRSLAGLLGQNAAILERETILHAGGESLPDRNNENQMGYA
jgi:hypothetical protein